MGSSGIHGSTSAISAIIFTIFAFFIASQLENEANNTILTKSKSSRNIFLLNNTASRLVYLGAFVSAINAIGLCLLSVNLISKPELGESESLLKPFEIKEDVTIETELRATMTRPDLFKESMQNYKNKIKHINR